jgi:hypothetical protein
MLAASTEKEENNCTPDARGSCKRPNFGSLLQKGFQREARSTLTQEQQPVSEENLYNSACNGTRAQGRCWFLGELGESCASTCESQGRHFSYVISDPKHPITPELVHHTPKVKSDAWAALECYVPSEDRYHPANENAARHFVEETETWSHENCKLACPCGGGKSDEDKCSWKAPEACAPEFMWKGVKYVGCALVDLDHDRPWCQHTFESIEKQSGGWSYCTRSCSPDEAPTPEEEDDGCGWVMASSCVKEFDYKNNHFVGCSGMDHDTPWCSNTEMYNGSWSHCLYSCAGKAEKEEPVNSVPSNYLPVPPKENTCEWTQAASCAKEFDYKGGHYIGCTLADHETPWCSNTALYQGSWNNCVYTCANGENSKEPVNQLPSNYLPLPQDTCEWTPAASCAKEFDYKGGHYVGCSRTDHETPWCSNTALYQGSWNNCVYTCASGDEKKESVKPVPSDGQLCTWQQKPACAKETKYKGVVYGGCIEQDYPTPWCSLDAVHDGVFETCTRVCTGTTTVTRYEKKGGSTAAMSGSFLQKIWNFFSQEQQPASEKDLYNAPCNGTRAQGRCWFLGELGENCATTCERQGRSFSFVISDPKHPVTPQLVKHTPKVKNGPWAALECYVPSEDRYHTANENAARHLDEGTETWRDDNCKLACPCGGSAEDECSWKAPQACAPEFMFKGVKYVGCATVDTKHEKPWCQHNFEEVDKKSGQDWSYCSLDCSPDEPSKPELPEPSPPVDSVPQKDQPTVPNEDNCEWTPAAGCAKEFDYKGVTYTGCTMQDYPTPWCSLDEIHDGAFATCTRVCSSVKEEKREPEIPAPPDDELCTWQPNSECAKAFEYKDVAYTGCTMQDYPTPWCSLDKIHKGAFETCTRVCAEKKEPEIPVPLDDELCTWQPTLECAQAFEYKGVEYTGCTMQDYPTPWCSLDKTHKGAFQTCTRVCGGKREPEIPMPSDDELCTWQPSSGCAKAFQYKGVDYTGCTMQDHPMPWCSLDRVHNGAWENCTRVCSGPSLPVAPAEQVPAPRPTAKPSAVPWPNTPVFAGDACARQPDTVNDAIGSSASLDEVGYKIVTSADSPVQMKRFICRVLGSVSCSATDLSALVAIVSYYVGAANEIGYSTFRSDLTTLCQGGDKFVMSQPSP